MAISRKRGGSPGGKKTAPGKMRTRERSLTGIDEQVSIEYRRDGNKFRPREKKTRHPRQSKDKGGFIKLLGVKTSRNQRALQQHQPERNRKFRVSGKSQRKLITRIKKAFVGRQREAHRPQEIAVRDAARREKGT